MGAFDSISSRGCVSFRVVEHPSTTIGSEDVRDGQNKSDAIWGVSKDDGSSRGIAQLDQPVDGHGVEERDPRDVEHHGATRNPELVDQVPNFRQGVDVEFTDEDKRAIEPGADRETIAGSRHGGSPELIVSRGQPVRRCADGPDDVNLECALGGQETQAPARDPVSQDLRLRA